MKMKLLPLFLLFFFILPTHAQRRTTAKPNNEDIEATKPTVQRSRGRSRYVATNEYQRTTDTSSTPEPVARKIVPSRRRVVENVEEKFSLRSSVNTDHSKEPLVSVSDSAGRPQAPNFGDTVEKIFTVDEIVNRRSSRPKSTVSSTPSSENANRRAPRPLTDYIERKNFKASKNTYEVQEITNDDFELVRRSKTSRLQDPETTTKAKNVSTKIQQNSDVFRISKFPRRNKASQKLLQNLSNVKSDQENLEPPITLKKASEKLESKSAQTEPVDPSNKSGETNLIEEQIMDTTLVPTGIESSPDPQVDAEIKDNFSKVEPSSTVKPTEAPKSQGNRRKTSRTSSSVVSEQTTRGSRIRTRGRSNQEPSKSVATPVPDFYFQAAMSTSVPGRAFRRRLDTVVEPRNVPSVFNADTSLQETRSRTGRKIDSTASKKASTENPARNYRKATTTRTPKLSEKSTFPSRNRFRSREMPIIDEQKLEVLPLFEVEPKLVHTRLTNRNNNLYSRNQKEGDLIEKSTVSTRDQADTKFRSRGTPTSITDKLPSSSNIIMSIEKTESSVRRPLFSRKAEVKESVVSEINEVTSRRKVSRKKAIPPNISIETAEKNAVGRTIPPYRGVKKSEVVIRKDNSEDIDADNYPEAFKAIIKAKKGKKESRSSTSSLSSVNTKNIVTSVPSSSTTTSPSNIKEINENDNEISPIRAPTKFSERWSRSRPTSVSFIRSTPEPTTAHRFSSRTTSSTTTTPVSISTHTRTRAPRAFSTASKSEKGVTFKSRNYGIEKDLEDSQSKKDKLEKLPQPTSLPTKVPKYLTTSKKLNRSKYRGDYTSKGSTTTAPKYIPTIPSVPYVPTLPAITSSRASANTWIGNLTVASF